MDFLPDTPMKSALAPFPVAHGLIVWDAQSDAAEYELRAGRILLGRGPHNQIRLRCEFLSSYHLEFVRCDQGYEVRDLGSHNGTQVNGKSIHHHLLRDGDRLLIGGRVVAHYMMVPDLEENPKRPLREQRLEIAMIQYLDLSRRVEELEQRLEVQTVAAKPHAEVPRGSFRIEDLLRRVEQLEAAVEKPAPGAVRSDGLSG